MRLLIGAAVVFVGAGVAITMTPNWRHTMIRQEWRDCQRKQANLREDGRTAESTNLMFQCFETYEREMAENFGTSRPTPFW